MLFEGHSFSGNVVLVTPLEHPLIYLIFFEALKTPCWIIQGALSVGPTPRQSLQPVSWDTKLHFSVGLLLNLIA